MGHPFPYVGSGIAAARKAMSCMVCFANPVPKAARAAIEKGAPSPLAGFFDWNDKLLVFGNDDDSLQWVVRATYDHIRDEDDEFEPDPELPSEAMWKEFNAELDRWLLRVHAKHPIALVIKPIDEEYSTATDAWHDWTCERIPSLVLPLAEKQLDEHSAQYIAEMWRMWIEGQPFDTQQKLVAALAPAEKKALGARKVLVEPKPPVAEIPAPTLEQVDQIWRALVAQGGSMRLEDAFTAAVIERGLPPTLSLASHLGELFEAKRHSDVIDLARAVLASGAEFPTNWYPTLADALIATGKLDEAEVVVRQLVGSLESYKPEMLTTAMRYHAARGEHDVEAMLYHAGITYFSTFSYSVPKTQVKQYGPRPSDISARFFAWLERWLSVSVWKPAQMLNVAHWLVWFDSIGVDVCAARVAEFTAERDRRLALYKRLEMAPDEATAREVIDELAPVVSAETAARAFPTFHERAPLAAFDLLDRGIANERREGFRYPTGDRVNAIVCLTYLALNQPALEGKLAHVYAIARGYVLVKNAGLHFNLACVACRLGMRTEALGHIARSLELGFPNPLQIHDDNDLAPLRGDAVFEKLFVDDVARRERAAKAVLEGEPKKPSKKKPSKKKPSKKKPSKKKPNKKKPAKKPAAKKPAKRKTKTGATSKAKKR
ncbi:MAG TPA: hypothetical protein VMZ53_14735 [Kofleriaceae bacterium]|nr:hypothetical protein [Kofleriaceae bacterium]